MTDPSYKKRLRELKADLEKDRMMLLKTNPMPRGVQLDNLDDYLNISDTGLNVNFPKKFSLVFGEVMTIQRAMDFAVYPNLLPDKLMMAKIPKATLRKVGGKRRSIPNYWSYVGYVIIERITQDCILEEFLTTDNKPIIDVTIKVVNSALLGECNVVVPNSDSTMYVGVVREVVRVLRETVESSAEDRKLKLTELLQNLKQKKDLSTLANIPVATNAI